MADVKLLQPQINAAAARAAALRDLDSWPDDMLLGYREIAHLTGRSEDTLRQARRRGKLPIPARGDTRRFMCRLGDIRAWLRGE
jgi:hypothetical protein